MMHSQATSTIDMFTPQQACEHLAVDEDVLIDMVNHGQLVAYNLGGNIRFKAVDIVTALAVLAVA